MFITSPFVVLVQNVGISFGLFLCDVSVADAIGSARHPSILVVTLPPSSVDDRMLIEIAVAAAIFRLFHNFPFLIGTMF